MLVLDGLGAGLGERFAVEWRCNLGQIDPQAVQDRRVMSARGPPRITCLSLVPRNKYGALPWPLPPTANPWSAVTYISVFS
jgi:hypothetical protein